MKKIFLIEEYYFYIREKIVDYYLLEFENIVELKKKLRIMKKQIK